MADFEFEPPEHGYNRRPPSPPSEESAHRRERVRQIVEGTGMGDEPKMTPEQQERKRRSLEAEMLRHDAMFFGDERDKPEAIAKRLHLGPITMPVPEQSYEVGDEEGRPD